MLRAIMTLFIAVAALLPAPLATGAGAQAVQAAQADTTLRLPLEPERRLRFTTDEGTWISLDVSPDGGTIVFDLLGDVYALPATGGRATPVTEGLGYDTQPRFSPDGRRIVFVSDRDGADNVWIADADGRNARPLTRERRTFFVSPTWTPDGRYIVVSRTVDNVARPGAFHLFLYHVDGGRGVPITGGEAPAEGARDPQPRTVLGAAFAGRDDRWIWASAAEAGGLGAYQIALVERATGRIFRRTHERAGALRPVLSPDGATLVYATRADGETGLKAVDIATGDERWLVRGIDRDMQESFPSMDLVPGSAFTPDGRFLIGSWGGRIRRVDMATGESSIIPFTVDVDAPMGRLARFEYDIDDERVAVRRIENPRLSPDGRRIAFSALGRVWIMALADGRARRLTDGDDGEFFPAWSPDGRHIAYVTWNDLEGGDIVRVAADGRSAPVRLTRRKAFWSMPAYSPDGTRIVAAHGPRHQRIHYFDELLRGRPQARDLVWIPADGGEHRVITPLNYSSRWASEHYGEPHFTSDTTRIHFHDPLDGLVSVRWDGTDRRQRLKVQSWEWTREPQVPADEILISPSGEHALALVNNNVYLIDVPAAGDRLPAISIASLAAAPLPVRRLSRAGADFVGWSSDGATIYWAIGSTLHTQPLTRARADGGGERTAAAHRVAITVPRELPTGAVVLRGARIITMRGDEVIDDGDVLVRGNRIAGVGPRGSLAIPAGAEIRDLAGRTIMPGWVDIHAHMWTPWGVHRAQNWEYLANLAYGVTATRDPQTMTADVITYADRVAVGEILGPRIFSTARGIFPAEDVHSHDDVRDVARRYAEHYRTETIKNYIVGDRKERQWLVMAAIEAGLTPTAEATNDFRMNMTLAFDGFAGQEHSWAVAPVYRDVVQLMAQSGLVYTPTMIINSGAPNPEELFYRERDVHADAKLRRWIPHEELDRRTLRRTGAQHPTQFVHHLQARAVADIVAAGGQVGLGAHGQLQGLAVHWEAWTLAAGGMPAHDVLRVGTIMGAQAIGHGRNFGSIEVGKLADLQVLDANPLEDIRNTDTVRYVMIDGRLYDTDTLDEVWPRQGALPRQWWWQDEPRSPPE